MSPRRLPGSASIPSPAGPDHDPSREPGRCGWNRGRRHRGSGRQCAARSRRRADGPACRRDHGVRPMRRGSRASARRPAWTLCRSTPRPASPQRRSSAASPLPRTAPRSCCSREPLVHHDDRRLGTRQQRTGAAGACLADPAFGRQVGHVVEVGPHWVWQGIGTRAEQVASQHGAQPRHLGAQRRGGHLARSGRTTASRYPATPRPARASANTTSLCRGLR